jgi:hypothetical protein
VEIPPGKVPLTIFTPGVALPFIAAFINGAT